MCRRGPPAKRRARERAAREPEWAARAETPAATEHLLLDRLTQLCKQKSAHANFVRPAAACSSLLTRTRAAGAIAVGSILSGALLCGAGLRGCAHAPVRPVATWSCEGRAAKLSQTNFRNNSAVEGYAVDIGDATRRSQRGEMRGCYRKAIDAIEGRWPKGERRRRARGGKRRSRCRRQARDRGRHADGRRNAAAVQR